MNSPWTFLRRLVRPPKQKAPAFFDVDQPKKDSVPYGMVKISLKPFDKSSGERSFGGRPVTK
jgi:hypothetical protein